MFRTAEIFYFIFLITNCKLHISTPPGYRTSLQPAKENIQHFKILNFIPLEGQTCGFPRYLPMSGIVPSLVTKEMFLSSGRSVESEISGAESNSWAVWNLNAKKLMMNHTI
jgi:hypothetical protein